MSAYVVGHYRISNPEGWQQYRQLVGQTIQEHGGEFVVADRASVVVEGQLPHVTVVLRFASKEAASSWYQSTGYQAIRHLRTDNTEDGSLVIVDGK